MFSIWTVFATWLLVGVLAKAPSIIDCDSPITLDSRSQSLITSDWTDGIAKAKFTNGPGGEYSVTWSGDKGNFVCGKGWNPGGEKTVTFSGTFNPEGNAYLSIYGWTTNPLVEYYITEYYGTHVPYDTPEATMKGNLTSNGKDYQFFTKIRKNKPSIQGTATFPQFWSVRNGGNLTLGNVNGTISTGSHFRAWQAAGLKMGKQNEMIIAVEGQNSSGTATITVGTSAASTRRSLPKCSRILKA